MPLSSATVQPLALDAAIDTQPIHTYLGWEIFLSRVFRERTDKGLWLHWCHPADRERVAQEHNSAVRYGYFIAPTQTLEEGLFAASQSIDAIIELEAMANERSRAPQNERLDERPDEHPDELSELYWHALSIAS